MRPLIQLIKFFRITRNFQAGVSWSWLELNCAELRPSRNWVWYHWSIVLRLISLFFQSVQRNASAGSASDGEIEKFIKRWLLLTLDRDGGRKERAQKQTNSTQGMFQMLTFTRVLPFMLSVWDCLNNHTCHLFPFLFFFCQSVPLLGYAYLRRLLQFSCFFFCFFFQLQFFFLMFQICFK